jgi:hypothetical protein
VSKLSQAWKDYDVQYGSCDWGDFGATRALHERLQQEQYECGAPSATCTDLYTEYLFWRANGEGQNCSKEIALARAETDPAAAQAKYFAFCGTGAEDGDAGEAADGGGEVVASGSCAASIQQTLEIMMKAGCGGWTAFIAIAEDVQLMCTVDPAAAASAEPTFCEPLHRANAGVLKTALDSSNSVSAREATLPGLCTSCFTALFRIKRQNADVLRRIYSEPELCITDPKVEQDIANTGIRYCLPRFEEAMTAASLNGQAANVCEAESMGRCGRLVWAHRLQSYGITHDEKTLKESYIDLMCARAGKEEDAEYCHSVTQDLAEGEFQETDPQEERECKPESTTGECVKPQFCQTWTDAADASMLCPSRCQTDVNNLVVQYGCCFNSWKLLLQENAGGDTDALAAANDLFARVEYLEDECCSSERREDGEANTCPDKAPGACAMYPNSDQFSVLVPIPYGWADAQSTAFEGTIVVDIAQALGVNTAAVSGVSTNQAGDAGNDITQVTFTIGSQSSYEGDYIRTILEARQSAETFYYDKTSQLYESADCEESPGTEYCSSSAQLASSLLLFVLLIGSSLNFA